MGFCINYLILISCFGALFFAILGVMTYFKSEALKTTEENKINNTIKMFSTAGVYYNIT